MMFKKRSLVNQGRKNLLARAVAGVLLTCVLTSFSACGKTPVLTPTGDGGYENNKSDMQYYMADDCYEPASYIKDKVVAQNDGVDFFAVEGVDGESWLYSPDFGLMLYAKDQKLPTLEEMHCDAVHICLEDETTIEIYKEENINLVNAIVEAYLNGTELIYPMKKAAYSFRVKFASSEYPWLRYGVIFLQYAEDYIVETKNENGEIVEVNYGKNFLYNRSEGYFVAIGDEMQKYIDDYYHNENAV